ncbi:hypothetical protein QBC46DRAFT_370147 [Diplogelasinospora grovesii]|uniref:DNA replication factor Cdt1 C-terminal domain-containing protein n=1 Tax=Diplogelasinospora grovesii TaxID=303347 RepID=A0AAN6NKT6_9PEZI|nr:hypothetical protein QBC46DRAFT_370147 [Diplogelasinospora grovesii]
MPGAVSRKTRSARGKLDLPAKKLPSTNITNFAHVSKLQTIGKDAAEKVAKLEAERTSSIEIVLSSRKRKADDEFQHVPSSPCSAPKKPCRETETKPIEAAVISTPKKRKTVTFTPTPITPESLASTPKSSRKRRLEDDSPVQQTSPKSQCQSSEADQAEALLERLNISSPIRKRTRPCVVAQKQPEQDFIRDLPIELLDLLDLQAAFLKTLSMQLAHNGSNTPVDVRVLCPSVTQAWGKRKVTLEDIQKCIGVICWPHHEATDEKAAARCPFYLADYGRGKICIELHPGSAESAGPLLREQKLNMDFEANLRTLWWYLTQDKTAQNFIRSLPQAPVRPCASVAKAAALFGGGQLEELKNGIARKQQQEKEAKMQAQARDKLVNPDGSKMSLLERIRHKEQQSQTGPQGPSPQELHRKAALQRAEDVAAVIGMLCMATTTGQARVSFTMTGLMVKLKDSLRMPISSEDGVCCVRLLAKEIAPQWLRIITIGGKENVVVQVPFQPTKAAIQERVKELLA